MEIEFVDAPPRPEYHNGGGNPWGEKGKWGDFFDALRARPGEWAKMGNFANPSTATQLKRGKYLGTSEGEFQATVRSTKDGRYDIYVRYVGGDA